MASEQTSTITLTFGDRAASHVGMRAVGTPATSGFSVDDLFNLHQRLSNTQFIGLSPPGAPPAAVLVIRNGIDHILLGQTNALWFELVSLPWDRQALVYGKVVNKQARYNLCFADAPQEPNYSHGQGRVIPFTSVPVTQELRARLGRYFGAASRDLVVEANYYYDISKCGISFHGDTERKKVIAARVGASLPLVFRWYYNDKPVSDNIEIKLNHGDMYIMSEKAVGFDWKERSILTLRHAAGCPKYTN